MLLKLAYISFMEYGQIFNEKCLLLGYNELCYPINRNVVQNRLVRLSRSTNSVWSSRIGSVAEHLSIG